MRKEVQVLIYIVSAILLVVAVLLAVGVIPVPFGEEEVGLSPSSEVVGFSSGSKEVSLEEAPLLIEFDRPSVLARADYIEEFGKEVIVNGILEVIIVDDFERDRSEVHYSLNDGEKRIKLYFEGEPGFVSGVRLSIDGKILSSAGEGEIAVSDFEVLGGEGGTRALGAGGNPNLGEQRTAAILINYQDFPNEPITPSEISSLIFDGAYVVPGGFVEKESYQHYIQEVSYGQAFLSGDVFGWYTLPPLNTAGCHPPQDIERIMNFADQDINFSYYDRYIFFFPKSDSNTCNFAGTSTLGMRNFDTPDGPRLISLNFVQIFNSPSPTYPWFYADIISTGVHEFGHQLGVFHANDWECGETVIGNNCISVDYGDDFDVMGQARILQPYNGFHRETIGWLASEQVLEFGSDVNGTFDVVLGPINQNSPGVKLVKIASRGGNFYSIEYYPGRCQPSCGSNYEGAFIRSNVYGNTGDTQLLDMSPRSDSASPVPNQSLSHGADSAYSVLREGFVFEDIDSRIIISTINVSPENILVRIEKEELLACSDGIDNDGDGLIDYPADPGCNSPDDDTEALTCEVLSRANTVYVLTENLHSSRKCFTIGADNVTLDGQGHTIFYSETFTGNGVENPGYDGVTIKNLVIEQSGTFPNSWGIYFGGDPNDGADNGIIENNIITTSGLSGHGISLSYSNSNLVKGNTVTTLGDFGIGISIDHVSNSNTIIDNTITSFNEGIYLRENSNSNTIIDNTITALGGIFSLSSDSHTIGGNTISTSHALGHGIIPGSDSVVVFNTITTSGSSARGISLVGDSNNILTGNKITTSGSSAYGVHLDGGSNSNTLTNNDISAANSLEINDLTRVDLYKNYLVYNNAFGDIRWTDDSSGGFLSDLTLEGEIGLGTNVPNIVIQDNFADLNVGAFTQGLINGPANITFYNLGNSNFVEPVILRDGRFNCDETTMPSCHNFTSLTASTVMFGVSSWSNYSIGEKIYQCNDGIDNDGDGLIDYPNDPECSSLRGNSEDPLTCGILNQTNTIYTLTQDVSSSGTCFTIGADNVTLNGQGHLVNYSQSSVGYAVKNPGYDGVTVNNLVTVQGGTSQSSHAIYFYSGAINGMIENNDITLTGYRGSGISVLLGANTRIINNDITSSGRETVAIGLSASPDSSIISNHIVTSHDTASGMFLLSSPNMDILSNTVITSGSSAIGIALSSNSNSNLVDNIIATSGVLAYGIRLSSNSNFNTLTNNDIFALNSLEIRDQTGNTRTNYLVYNNSFGEIRWTDSFFLTDLTLQGTIGLGTNVIVQDNLVVLNYGAFTQGGINSAADITLYNIGNRGFVNPFILRNGVEVCYGMTSPSCIPSTSLDASTVSFSVNFWGSDNNGESTYSIGEIPAVCGDDVIGSGEECDDGANNGIECSPFYGYSCDYCGSSCQVIILQGGFCGDGIIESGEECDGSDLNGATCRSIRGSGYGTLSCSSSCSFDLRGCNDNEIAQATIDGVGEVNGGQGLVRSRDVQLNPGDNDPLSRLRNWILRFFGLDRISRNFSILL